jgi:3-hydroxyisobutyryl-CoA hydrolase
VLVDKTKGRPAWSPAEPERVEDEDVVLRFFSPRSPLLAGKPALAQITAADAGKKDRRTTRFALLREDEIGALVRGSHGSSAAFAMTKDELLDKAAAIANGKSGVREKVLEVVGRRTKVERDGEGQEYLVWKH